VSVPLAVRSTPSPAQPKVESAKRRHQSKSYIDELPVQTPVDPGAGGRASRRCCCAAGSAGCAAAELSRGPRRGRCAGRHEQLRGIPPPGSRAGGARRRRCGQPRRRPRRRQLPPRIRLLKGPKARRPALHRLQVRPAALTTHPPRELRGMRRRARAAEVGGAPAADTHHFRPAHPRSPPPSLRPQVAALGVRGDQLRAPLLRRLRRPLPRLPRLRRRHRGRRARRRHAA
jgi:hypothetical protein